MTILEDRTKLLFEKIHDHMESNKGRGKKRERVCVCERESKPLNPIIIEVTEKTTCAFRHVILIQFAPLF